MGDSSTGGIIIAAPASGCGKTVLALGLLRHLARSGRPVAPAKVGPDYIDPAFLGLAGRRPCLNLDPWAMRPATLTAAAAELARQAEIVVCEGVMGLFDGANDDTGSTADLAELGGWPVVLVVDAGGQAASAAAVVRGFATHRRGVTVAAVVFNRVAGDRHAGILRRSMARALPAVEVLGCLPRDDGLILPERHLGLVQADEHSDIEAFIERAADMVHAHVDVEALAGLARPWRSGAAVDAGSPLAPLGQRIALARDLAFAFSYPGVVEGWRRAGAEIEPFSPLAGEGPAGDADAVYLPGGYPELHAGRLAAAEDFMAGLRAAADRGAAVYGECGGYMVLGKGLADGDGVRHAMAGLLPLETSFAQPRLHLGYRRAVLGEECPLGIAGARFRGHEFHYASVVEEGPGAPLFEIADAGGRDLGAAGRRAGRVMGSFVHLIDIEEGDDGG